MKNTMIKRNILLLIVSAIAVMVLAFALVLANAVSPAAAEINVGNNAGSGSIANPIEITLDVNGKVQNPEERDAQADDLTKHNGDYFRKRYISWQAVRDRIKTITGDNSIAGVYSFDSDTIINGSTALSVKVEGRSTGTGPNLEVEALSITETGAAYFSVELVPTADDNKDNKNISVYFKVTVTDTFVPWTNASTKIYVGYQVGTESDGDLVGKEYITVDGKPTAASSYNSSNNTTAAHAAILTIKNYEQVEIDLSQVLLGRALYKESENSTTAGTSTEACADANDRLWTLHSVKNFKIDSDNIVFERLSGLTIQNAIVTSSQKYDAGAKQPPVRVTPKVTGSIAVDANMIARFTEQNHVDFWMETHIMNVPLQLVSTVTGRLEAVTVKIPVKFVPSSPNILTIPSDRLRLNITSSNVYNYNNGNGSVLNAEGASTNDVDYGAIYIRPSDLIEYSAPSNYVATCFDHRSTSIDGYNDIHNNSIRIDRMTVASSTDASLIEDESASASSIPTVYRIKALNNSRSNANYTVRFRILYYTGTTTKDEHHQDISISISTYGGYSVVFEPIRGKDPAEYARNSDVFAEVVKDSYTLTKVTSLNLDILSATLNSDNKVILSPNVDVIKGQAIAKVRLEFTNNSTGQILTIDSEEISIDVNAGSLFSRFDDWQVWLIIAACVLGGIILILLIVWLFIRAISKHKQDELAMQAPVSSYIIKLNSTIAANQAQQRAAQNQALSQASTQMLLGAGPATGAAPMPDTLQLASGIPSTPSMPNMSSPSMPQMSEPQAAVPPDSENLEELIAKYISDEELLERIFTEKYEPKGMVRRTFFKSKDLQARELDKEKKRIIERYKTPMPMDEAIMSEKEIQNAASTGMSAADSQPAPEEPAEVEYFVLDFDPESPLYVEEETKTDEFSEEKIDIDASPEESRLSALERQNDVLNKELAELKSRLDKVQVEVNRAKTMEDELREKIAKAEKDDEQYSKDIEELEFKLASAKNKDKDKITRDIGIKEEKKQRNSEELERLRHELELLLSNGDRISGIYAKLNDLQKQKDEDLERIIAEREKAKADYDSYLQRMEIIRKKQEMEAKVVSLEPLLQAVNNTDYELKRIDALEVQQSKERESLKSTVAQAKAQILGATDFGIISDLNAQISDANSRLSELEREITKTTKQKSDLGIELNSQRRKANDFITKNEIPLEDVIKTDDKVLGEIEFEIVKAKREKDKEEAEKAVATAQAVYEDLSASSDDVTMIAIEVASTVSELEEEIASVQAQLDDINSQMELASEDEKLELMVTQGDTSDKLDELKAKLEQAGIDGTKRKMEAQSEYDARIESARADLDRANEEFELACKSFNDFINNTNPIDLITSGSGIISQDQKKIEAESLKKQLERSKMEAEQARMAAQQAQEQAEEARRKAQAESEEARLEAERTAQEAIERAEKARIEAEEKAKADIEAAEQARKDAEAAMAAEADEARRRAIEESEETKRQAEAEAEEARRQAEAEVEEAKRKAMEESEEAKRKAQEEIEEMRRKAEEEAESKRLEEENKRREEEARQKAEAERSEAIAKKVALRKDQIIALRNEMKDLKGDEDAKNLRERLYNLQLTFDEDEHGSNELMDFYNKTMDDIQNSGEIARLKAENAKKPQRVVRKVTERVNRIPKRKPGARPGAAKAGARPGARPGAARPGAARPGAAKPGARPGAARPGAARPGARPGAAKPGARPGARPSGNGPRRPK